MTNDHAPFLSAILADPDGDAPRLIYADWLEEQGDAPRAELIRVQCELAAWKDKDAERCPQCGLYWRFGCISLDYSEQDYVCNNDHKWKGGRYKDLQIRERQLLKEHFYRWTDSLPDSLTNTQCPDCAEQAPDYETNVVECRRCDCTGQVPDEEKVEFRRGFVSAVTCDNAGVWNENAVKILTECPLLETASIRTLYNWQTIKIDFRNLTVGPHAGKLLVEWTAEVKASDRPQLQFANANLILHGVPLGTATDINIVRTPGNHWKSSCRYNNREHTLYKIEKHSLSALAQLQRNILWHVRTHEQHQAQERITHARRGEAVELLCDTVIRTGDYVGMNEAGVAVRWEGQPPVIGALDNIYPVARAETDSRGGRVVVRML